MNKINESEFNEIIKNKVLIDFYADWCGPCRMMSEVFESIKNDINVPIAKIDVDDSPNISREYGVLSIPTIILFENGKELKRHVGFLNEEDLKQFLQKSLN